MKLRKGVKRFIEIILLGSLMDLLNRVYNEIELLHLQKESNKGSIIATIIALIPIFLAIQVDYFGLVQNYIPSLFVTMVLWFIFSGVMLSKKLSKETVSAQINSVEKLKGLNKEINLLILDVIKQFLKNSIYPIALMFFIGFGIYLFYVFTGLANLNLFLVIILAALVFFPVYGIHRVDSLAKIATGKNLENYNQFSKKILGGIIIVIFAVLTYFLGLFLSFNFTTDYFVLIGFCIANYFSVFLIGSQLSKFYARKKLNEQIANLTEFKSFLLSKSKISKKDFERFDILDKYLIFNIHYRFVEYAIVLYNRNYLQQIIIKK